MIQIIKSINKRYYSKYKENFWVFILMLISTVFIFSGIFEGKVISNANYLFNFEPWIYYRENTDSVGNFILSDMVDGNASRNNLTKQMRNGEIPLWDYSDKIGNIGIINILQSYYYPLRLIPWLLFGMPIGWSIEIILKFTFGGFFMYLLLKKFGICSKVSLLVSTAYMFGGTQLSEFPTEFSTVTLTAPIVFYFLERFFQRTTWRNSLYLLLSLLLFLTTRFVSIIFFFSFWISIYSLFRLCLKVKNKRNFLIKSIVTIIFFLVISAIATLPTVEYFSNDAGIDLNYRNSFGLRQSDPITGLTVIVSNLFGHPILDFKNWTYGSFVNSSIFVGYLTILSLFTGGLIRLIKKKEFHLIIFLLLAILLIFEIYLFPFENIESITNYLPFFHGNPAIYQRSVLQFLIAILGAFGLDYIFREEFIKSTKEKFFLSILSVLFSSCSILIINHFLSKHDNYSDYHKGYISNIKTAIVLICLLYNVIIHRGWIFSKLQNFLSDWISRVFVDNKKGRVIFLNTIVFILFLFVLFEGKLNSNGWIPYADAKNWYPDTEMTDFQKENIKYSRVLPIGEGVAVPAILEGYGLPTAAGRLPVPETYRVMLQNAYPKAYVDHPTQVVFQEFETNLNDMIWDLVDVRYFVASRNIDKEKVKKEYSDGIKIIELSDSTLLENSPAPKHAWLVNDGVFFNSAKEMAEGTKKDWDIYENVAFLSDKYLLENDSSKKDEKKAVRGEVLDYKQYTNSISIKLKNDEPTYLIVSSNFYPGWKVKVDGVESKIIPAYGFLKAIQIKNPGEHTVELVFRPDSLVYGAIISVFGLLSAGIFYTFAIRREKHITSK